MSDRLTAWQCIGCGRIEDTQPCVGICHDRKVEFVYASEHETLLAQFQRASSQVKSLRSLVRQLAWTNPHDGEWEKSFRALQQRARRVIATTGGD